MSKLLYCALFIALTTLLACSGPETGPSATTAPVEAPGAPSIQAPTTAPVEAPAPAEIREPTSTPIPTPTAAPPETTPESGTLVPPRHEQPGSLHVPAVQR